MIRWLFFFLTISSTTFCQVVEGTIVDDETGKPIPFASIGIAGTSKGTSSNLNGQFSLMISEPAELIVTCIGYQSKHVSSSESLAVIRLKPMVTQLDAVIISDKPLEAKRIIRKAFTNTKVNFSGSAFMQTFFYRHYCKDDDVYGRLIEASVDVWKPQGYRTTQQVAGEKDEIRITQLRRSRDNTVMAQGHEPIAVGSILETDLVGFQMEGVSDHLNFYNNVSSLKVDVDNYIFKLNGITSYDGQEVYEIGYVYKKDSVLMTSGEYRVRAQAKGTLFITTDTYAFVKTEEVKTFGKNSVETSVYYRNYGGRYYPYHFIIEGENMASDSSSHSFHIELMSVEIKKEPKGKFTGSLPTKEELLNIPYDSAFWISNTILKTTPLEDDIIRDLGGGASLSKQFLRYKQYELNVHNGGVQAEEKFRWLRDDSKGNRILYLVFWSENFRPYLVDLELAKQLNRKYRNKITFVYISLDDDKTRWEQMVQKYGFYIDGIINYRIGSKSQLAESFGVNKAPAFVLLKRDGEAFGDFAKRPSDPLLSQDFDSLLVEQ